jgi:NAD(P)-dependent dehydrogenase (short-subunit alcohol dehydrogenase family)
MDLQLQNKAALVTGATAGIGLAIAQELAREGAAVIITGRAQDKIQRALDTIGNGAKGIVADLSHIAGTEPHGMTKLAQLAISRGLAETTKGTGVTVNTVMPGPTRSEGSVQFLRHMSSDTKATDVEQRWAKSC